MAAIVRRWEMNILKPAEHVLQCILLRLHWLCEKSHRMNHCFMDLSNGVNGAIATARECSYCCTPATAESLSMLLCAAHSVPYSLKVLLVPFFLSLKMVLFKPNSSCFPLIYIKRIVGRPCLLKWDRTDRSVLCFTMGDFKNPADNGLIIAHILAILSVCSLVSLLYPVTVFFF